MGLALGLLAVMAGLLAASETAAQAVREGLALCGGSVIPALFPFLVVSRLFVATGSAAALGQLLAPLTRRMLGVSGPGGTAVLLGLLGGYPVGAQTAGELARTGAVSRQEGQRLLLFCNNCGPAFILGVAGLGCFGSLRAGGLLWAVHVLAALGIVLVLPRRPLPPGRDAAGVRPPAFAAAFVRSVRDAAGAMVQICGFVVFFLAALRLTARLTGLSHPLLSGAVELTQGILALPATPTGFVWAAALLGWGGLSVHGQSAAVLSGTDLPLGPYLAAKAAQAALSALLAWPVSRYLWG